MRVGICLPTRNESESIQDMIDRLRELGYTNDQIFVSDERSTDGTIAIAERNGIPVYQRTGSGKGCGIIKAMEVCRQQGFDVIVIVDCDCSYPPEEIPTLLQYMPEYDMVVGQRPMKDISFLHRLANVIHSGAVNQLFGSNLTDINSGLRAFKVREMGDLVARGFDTEAEMTAKAIKRRMKIKEVEIPFLVRKGESKIRARDGITILWRIVRERLVD